MNEQQMPTITDIGEAIEAILFAAGYPVKYDKLAEVLGLSAKDVRLLCEHMAAEYEKEGRARLKFQDVRVPFPWRDRSRGSRLWGKKA